MSRFLALILIGIISGLTYKYLGFEVAVVSLLTLIYWAIPVDTNIQQ